MEGWIWRLLGLSFGLLESMGPFHEIRRAEKLGSHFVQTAFFGSHFRNERAFALVVNMCWKRC